MGDRAAPLPADSQYRSSIPLPACIQPQHEHLAEEVRTYKAECLRLGAERDVAREEVRRLKEENRRLESRQYLIQSSRKSMLDKLCEALGWQGGTIHQALAEVRRLRAAFLGRKPPCPDAQDYETLQDYREALEQWEGKP